MDWRLDGKAPVFVQLCDRLREEILRGTYPLGQQFPTVRQLAQQAAVNPNTVQRALAVLEGEGLLYTSGTQGRFVTNDSSVLLRVKEEIQRKTVQDFLLQAKALDLSPSDIVRIILEQEER